MNLQFVAIIVTIISIIFTAVNLSMTVYALHTSRTASETEHQM